VIVEGQIVYPWRKCWPRESAEGLGAREVVIAAPVAAQAAADRIPRGCIPCVSQRGDGSRKAIVALPVMRGLTPPERLKSIMMRIRPPSFSLYFSSLLFSSSHSQKVCGLSS